MIDFHNHILPDVDDGPKLLEESVDMLRYASKQGITDVVNTVHFQHPKMDNKNVDYQYLKNKVQLLQKKINDEKIDIKIHLSAEVFYLPNLLDVSKNPLTIIGNKYMLIEFKSNIYPTGYEDEFYNLQLSGITPIVAHPERYRFIQKDINIIEDWLSRGYVVQIDAGSIIGQFGDLIKNVSFRMINNGYIHLIGSDSHNSKKRNFCLFDAYRILEERKSKKFVEYLKNNSWNILNGNEVISLNEIKKKDSFSYLKKKIINFCKFRH